VKYFLTDLKILNQPPLEILKNQIADFFSKLFNPKNTYVVVANPPFLLSTLPTHSSSQKH